MAEGGEAHPADAGQTVTFDVVVPEGGLPFICSIPGHAAAGMTGTIKVAGSTAASGGDSHGGPAPDTGAIEADPNAPAYTLYDATAPQVLEGDTHEITLTIEEKEMHGRQGLRPEGLDVQRQRARPRHPCPPGRQDPRPARQPRDQ